ncbi:MAG: EVE domain-containing protein [Gammaproteobacteria bacterium]|nr:EVE domain-containing protein [Gammaproteobacteria bacterium]
MNFWLFKSEPDAFSIDDLKQKKIEHWDGVRNYQARNYMRDEMKQGDLGFFYHSSCKQPGIVGIIKIKREAYADFTSWDPEGDYYDPKSSVDNPRWVMVDVQFVKKFKRVISLDELKQNRKLQYMQLLKKGNRLSIMPLHAEEWETILALL